MLDRIKMVKRKMDESLEQLCEVSWMFSRQPEKDFTRNRNLSFPKLVSFLLAMEGGTLTTELIERFGCSPDTASASAFVQQRSKLAPETFPSLFDLFVRKTQPLIPRSRECSGWWTEKGKHKIVLRDKRKPCGGGCTDHLRPYQFALGVNGVTK